MKNKVIIFTGAGLSAESGISTFRDSNGLWENHKIDEVCNIKTWEKNRSTVFDFYNQRRLQLKNVAPSAGHLMIKELQDKYGVDRVIVLTQNIDDLLERAGVHNVIHLHGKLTEMQCKSCQNKWNIEYESIEADNCVCQECGSKKTKPNVVFFGEEAEEYYTMKRVFRDVRQEDVVVVIGTMGNVVPINSHMQTTYGYKILNNLEASIYINAKLFNEVFYEKIGSAYQKILNSIAKKML